MDTLKNVRFEHLSQEQKELANLLGFEVFLTLVERCGGTQLYVPKAETVGRAARNAMIRAEYNGGNSIYYDAFVLKNKKSAIYVSTKKKAAATPPETETSESQG